MTGDLPAILGDVLEIPGLEWDRVAVARNIGPLLPSVELQGDLVANRGLCAVVGDRRGQPLWFCKVRPAHHELFRHEAAITAELASELAVTGVVPEARTAVAGSVAILATRWVPGHSLSRALGSAGGAAWERLAGRALAAGDAVRAVLSRRPVEGPMPGAAEGFATDLRLATGRAEVDGDLRAALEGLPPRPQHGDFWPRNLRGTDSAWTVLDFERSGLETLPLHDVTFFLRAACPGAAPGHGVASAPGWAARSAAGSRGRWFQAVLREACEREELMPSQGAAAYIAGVAQQAATFLRRGLAASRVDAQRRELAASLEHWRTGRLAEFLFGSA